MCERIVLYPYKGTLLSHGIAFGGDGDGLELDRGGDGGSGGDYMGVYICQSSSNFTLIKCAFYIQIIPQ